VSGGQLDLELEHPTAGIPVVPYVGQDTSLEAAMSMSSTGQAKNLERQVFDLLRESPRTDEEICTQLGIGGNTGRPRRRSLVMRGLVEDSGDRRPTYSGRRAIVWRVCNCWQR
jgi:hypothetical protein